MIKPGSNKRNLEKSNDLFDEPKIKPWETRRQESGRGFPSFLTWPFFLAQIWAADQFVGYFKAEASEAGASNAVAHPARSSADPAHPLTVSGAPHSKLDDATTEPTSAGQNKAIDPASKLAAAQPEPPEASTNTLFSDKGPAATGDGGEGGGGSSSGADHGAGSGEESSGLALKSNGDDGFDSEGHTDVTVTLADEAGQVIALANPVIEFAAHVIGSSSPVVPSTLSSLVSTLDTVITPTNEVIADSSAILTHALGGVADLATDLIGISSSAINGTLSPIADVVHRVATPVADVINDAGSPLAHATGSVVDDMATTVASVSSPLVSVAENVATFATGAIADSGSGLIHALGGAVDLATDVIGISSSAVSGASSPIVVAVDSVANPTAEVINDDGSILTSAGSVVEIASSVVNTTSATVGSDLSGLSHSVPAGETHLESMGGTTLHGFEGGPGISLHPISSLQNADPEIAPHSVTGLTSGGAHDIVAPVSELTSAIAEDAGVHHGSLLPSAGLDLANSEPAHAFAQNGDTGLVSGGTMDFPADQAVTPPANELFANGGHTDYGIALQNDAGPNTSLPGNLQTATADVAHPVVDSVSPPPEKADDHASLPPISGPSDPTIALDHVGIHVHSLL